MYVLLTSNPFEQMMRPIVNLLDMAINPILTLVGAIGAIYCIFLGIKLAKADGTSGQRKSQGRAEECSDRLYPDFRADAGPEAGTSCNAGMDEFCRLIGTSLEVYL